MPRPKKQKPHLARACRLRECEQKVKELSASAVEVIMQRHSQLSEEELVGVQENHDADAEIAWELSEFENESELKYPKFHCELNLSSIFGVHVRLMPGITVLLRCKVFEKSFPKPSNRYQLRLSIDITRTLDAYYSGHTYGSTEFKNHVICEGHRRLLISQSGSGLG
jgi:hypothetical protein